MATSLLDPDEVRYSHKGEDLILSVSDEAFDIKTGLATPMTMYVEKFKLTTDLGGENEDINTPTPFRLFAHQIDGLRSSTKPVSIKLLGKDGTLTSPDGVRGGILEFYIENITEEAAQNLRISVAGGKGWGGVVSAEKTVPRDGGNGGDGGHVTLVLGRPLAFIFAQTLELLQKLHDSESKWPLDFRDAIRAWASLMADDDVQKTHTLPKDMQTAEQILKGSKEAVQDIVRLSYGAFIGRGRGVVAESTQRINTNGGGYGIGERTSKGQGKSGHVGTKGSHTVLLADDAEEMLQTTTCFAHPVQCQMLLDKAKLLIFCGNPEQRARALNTLRMLQQRLYLFGDASTLLQLPKSPLAEAYRKAERSFLHIVSGPPDEEPVSVSKLRAVQKETVTTLNQLLAPRHANQTRRIEVPRASFSFHERYAASFLQHLQETEVLYLDLLQDTMTKEDKASALQKRGSLCDSARGQRQDLIEEVKSDMAISAARISLENEHMHATKQALLAEFEKVREDVNHAFNNLSFENLIDAAGQIAFTVGGEGMLSFQVMAATQAASLAHSMLAKIQDDTGAQINRAFLLHSVHQIGDTVESLGEGYRMLKGGGANFDDPGCGKLLLAEAQANRLLGDFNRALGSEVVAEVKKRFHDYVAAAQARNAAVLDYSSDVQLLIRLFEEMQDLQAQKRDIIRAEYDQLGLDHPVMTAFMRKTYMTCITYTQTWLQKMQQSYAFVALDRTNILGDAMADFSFSRPTHLSLANVHECLKLQYAQRVEKWGRAMQLRRHVEFPLDSLKQDMLRAAPKHGRILSVPIDPSSHRQFFGDERVDLRLLAVRFLVDGVTTTSGLLDVTIVHSGQESIIDGAGTRFEFSHQPVPVNFCYRMDTKDWTGPGTVEGTIGQDPKKSGDYALVGPFTTWYIKVLSVNNPGLDLTHAEKPRLEFDFLFRMRNESVPDQDG